MVKYWLTVTYIEVCLYIVNSVTHGHKETHIHLDEVETIRNH